MTFAKGRSVIRIKIRKSNRNSIKMTKIIFTGFGRRKKRAQERRDSIIQAAIQVLREKGYEQMTMQDIAEAADLSTSSVYYYFDGKLAILEAAFSILAEEMTATTENTVNSKNPQQNSVSQFIQRLNYLKEFNLVSVLAEAKNSPELQPRINKMIQFSRQELVRRMQLLQEKKQVQMVDADLAADMILSMGLGALILTKLDAENSPEPKRMEEILGAFNSLIMTNQIDLNGIRES